MITKQQIREYFDMEAEEAKKSWEQLMKLPLKEHIRKRKAIADLQFVEYAGRTAEGHLLYKFQFKVNLSDFKEGEKVLLHREDKTAGMSCTLSEYTEFDQLTLDVYAPSATFSEEQLKQGTWVLDKDLVDLRQFVFSNFLCDLPSEPKFWQKHILNSHTPPAFANRQQAEKDLADTQRNYSIQLTDTQREAVLGALTAQDYYLIQGPPGTGKSYVLGLIIIEEVADLHHSVAVIGPNHLAINNALGQVVKQMPFMSGIINKIGQTYQAPTVCIADEEGNEHTITNLERVNAWEVKRYDDHLSEHGLRLIMGFTPYCLYTSRARGLEFDTLIIDEAGQMTIPLALMGMIKAKKVILAGDHKQLPPIIGSDKVDTQFKQSIFQRLMQPSNHTMLDISFRMCGPICQFVSTLFYDGQLKAMNETMSSRIVCSDKDLSFDAPVRLIHVDDQGEQTSDREADRIVHIIRLYEALGLPLNEIGVLAPFRAQAAHIRRLLKKENDLDAGAVAVDTIDKMQGQEREVIIFSMVAGDLDYMTEMADFLYNPNKLNVAFSRAKSKLIIVGNFAQLERLDITNYPHLRKMLELYKSQEPTK